MPKQKTAEVIKSNSLLQKLRKILGMTVANLSAEERKSLSAGNNFGIKVTDVSGNPAYESGLLKNDIIYQISGKNIQNIKQFNKIIKNMKKGDFASLLVRRSQGNSIYLAIKIE